MVIRKKVLRAMNLRLDRLDEQRHTHGPDGLVTCEKCGCRVERVVAHKGRGQIKTRLVYKKFWYPGAGSTHRDEDYIYYPYYCKIHKPKEKGDVKQIQKKGAKHSKGRSG